MLDHGDQMKEELELIKEMGLELTARQKALIIEYMKDFSIERAARACCMPGSTATKLISRSPTAKQAIAIVLAHRLKYSNIDAEWIIYELVDNHLLARQEGNLTASNNALKLLMQHKRIDAMATSKVDLNLSSDKEIVERLRRGRLRMGDDGTWQEVGVEDQETIGAVDPLTLDRDEMRLIAEEVTLEHDEEEAEFTEDVPVYASFQEGVPGEPPPGCMIKPPISVANFPPEIKKTEHLFTSPINQHEPSFL